jgi:hypothetical protein
MSTQDFSKVSRPNLQLRWRQKLFVERRCHLKRRRIWRRCRRRTTRNDVHHLKMIEEKNTFVEQMLEYQQAWRLPAPQKFQLPTLKHDETFVDMTTDTKCFILCS